MARSIQEIYDALITEKETMTQLNALQPSMDNAQNLLSDLTSSSRVAIWRLIFFVLAFGIWTLEKLFDEHKAWVEARALELFVGNKAWYHSKTLEFQLGDSLVFENGVYRYPTVNTENQIIKRASVSEVGGDVLIKLVKLSSGLPAPLTNPELLAFVSYMEKVKFAGVDVIYISRLPDLLKIYFKIYYDPLLMTDTGELLSAPGTFPVVDTIKNYCFGLQFDGVFSFTELTDLLQKTPGVHTPIFLNASAKVGTNPYADIGDFYNPAAGYLKIDDDFPLSDTITYLPR